MDIKRADKYNNTSYNMGKLMKKIYSNKLG